MGRWSCLLGLLGIAASCLNAGEPPQRIVSLNLVSDIVLTALVEPPRIAALSHLAPNPDLSLIAHEVVGLRTIRGTAEEVMALRSDLAIGARWGQGPTLALLRRLGVPTHEIPLAQSYDEIIALVEDLAAAVGEPERGRALLEGMQATRAALAAHAPTPAPRALLFGASGFSGGSETLTAEVLADAGLRRAASGRLDLEQLIVQAPDVLVSVVYRPGHPCQTDLLLDHPALRRVRPEIRRVSLALLLNATHRTPEASQAIQNAATP
jgi:iron complex transport system substrate-binding protein